MAIAGPGATTVVSALTKATASTASYLTETATKQVLGVPIKPVGPVEMVADIALTTVITTTVSKGFQSKVLKPVTEKLTNALSRESVLDKMVTVFHGFPLEKSTLATIIAESVPPAVTSKVIRHVVSPYMPTCVSGNYGIPNYERPWHDR